MSDQRKSQDALVARAREGDRDALNTLWEANRPWIAVIVSVHRPRVIDVEDLMQDVAVRYVSRIDTLREVRAFKPWLRQIIINVCRGSARKLKPMARLATTDSISDDGEAGGVAIPEGTGPAADDLIATTEASQLLYRQVMSLPPDYREPLLLRCVQSLSYQQISEMLELPVTTVETRLARGRRMLRAEMGDACDERTS